MPDFRKTNAAKSALACDRDGSDSVGNLGWKCLIGFWASTCKNQASVLTLLHQHAVHNNWDFNSQGLRVFVK